MIQWKDVVQARERIAPYIVRTPLIRVPALDEDAGCQVYLKHEGFQRIGAFKLRGAMNKALSLTPEERARGLVCASSGNHAQGVACAARQLGCRAKIVVPTNVNPVKLAGIHRWGAQVELVGTLASQREARAAELVQQEGMVEIHPYNDPYVAAGQGTLALEVLEDLPDASLVAAPIGGGGLISGIATAVKGVNPRVRTVEWSRRERPGTPAAGRRAGPFSWSRWTPLPTAPAPTTPCRITLPSLRSGWTSCTQWRTAGSSRPCSC